MKYKNVLGKDFKRKEDAYKRFQECRDEMVRTFQLGPSHMLTEETPVGGGKEWSDTSKYANTEIFENAQSMLDEAFAFCENKEIHDNIINNLHDIKYEMSEANKEVLVNFAKTYPANRERFQELTLKHAHEWKKSMNEEDWKNLCSYMGELDNFHKVANGEEE